MEAMVLQSDPQLHSPAVTNPAQSPVSPVWLLVVVEVVEVVEVLLVGWRRLVGWE